VEDFQNVGSEKKSNANRLGKCGRKRKDDAALPSNKRKQPAHGAQSFLRYQELVKVECLLLLLLLLLPLLLVLLPLMHMPMLMMLALMLMLLPDAIDAAAYAAVDMQTLMQKCGMLLAILLVCYVVLVLPTLLPLLQRLMV
jgi:hypothetical protein